MKHITIIGTQGVPANYGGFESLVENIIGDNKSPNVNYTVFCSSKDLPQHILINWYGVLKEFRCKGFGSQILNWLIDLCKTKDEHYLTTYTHKIANCEACKLYKNDGNRWY